MQAAVKALTNEEYHANTSSVSNSMLCVMLEEGRRAYEAAYVNQDAVWSPPTREQEIGTVLHAMTLQPDTLDDVAAVIPADALSAHGHRRGTAWEEYKAEHDGLILLTEPEYDEVFGMHRALMSNPVTGPLLREKGETEQSIFWQCKTTGIARKVRPDRHYPGMCLDLKTSRDISPRGFGKAAAKYFYHCQRASYVSGLEELTGVRPEFLLLAVQRTPPYTCCAYNLDEQAIGVGELLTMQALQQIAACRESGDWSEPGEHGILELPLPRYSYTDTDTQFKEDGNG
jgi:hypothetical protein